MIRRFKRWIDQKYFISSIWLQYDPLHSDITSQYPLSGLFYIFSQDVILFRREVHKYLYDPNMSHTYLVFLRCMQTWQGRSLIRIILLNLVYVQFGTILLFAIVLRTIYTLKTLLPHWSNVLFTTSVIISVILCF